MMIYFRGAEWACKAGSVAYENKSFVQYIDNIGRAARCELGKASRDMVIIYNSKVNWVKTFGQKNTGNLGAE